MQFRAMAFLTRSVRQDSRLLSHHGMRAAMAGLILYLFFAQTQMSAVRSAVGAGFASTVVYCCYWFLTLLGGIHFSSAISEEKDEQTLALLKMTGASPLAILAGKSVPRLAVAALFLIVVAPFLLLSITLGGVLKLGLLSAILSILCYAVMLSQLGLFASVVSSSTRRAFSLTCILWLLFELPHWWSSLTYGAFYSVLDQDSRSWFEELTLWLSHFSLISNLRSTLLAFSPTDIWHVHMTYELCVAFAFFVLSWLVFEPCTSRAISEGSSNSAGQGLTRVLQLPVTRAWNNSVMWKSWQHGSGGIMWLIVRVVIAPALMFGFGVFFSFMASGKLHSEVVIGWGLGLGVAFLLINIARLLGRVFNEEIHNKTLASLVMLPQPASKTFWAMIQGLLPGILAASVTAVCAFLLLCGYVANEGGLDDLAEAFVQPWWWHFFSWVLVTAHIGLYLTTYVRYGGMLLAVAFCWLVGPMVFGVTFGLFAMAARGLFFEEVMQYLLPMVLITAELIACVFFQRAIHKRLIHLAGK